MLEIRLRKRIVNLVAATFPDLTWLEPGRRLAAEFPTVACYELPVIGKMNPLFWRFIAEHPGESGG